MDVAALFAAIAAAAPAPAAPEGQRIAVERFVAACVNGELTSAGLRQIARSDLPMALRRALRDPAARYYRFDERPASYLAVEADARPDARYHTTCTLATPVDGPWSLFDAVMNHLRPGRAEAVGPPVSRPRNSRAMAASSTNFEAGYTIQSVRSGGYTLLQALQFRTKSDAESPAPVRDPR